MQTFQRVHVTRILTKADNVNEATKTKCSLRSGQ